ncbi:MAG: type II toxin-antitoxin system ParD family antitoxin [Cyanobacteriota bacterium]
MEESLWPGGYSTVSEYFRKLIRQDRARKAKERLESLLLEGLEFAPATPMTDQDWENVCQAIRDRISQRNQRLIDG